MRKNHPSQRSGHVHGRIRLIGGHLKRSQLEVLDSPGLRPTPDRVRETLFNWIGFDIAGSHVLDLFAGSGALGFEAISRGAASTLLIERDAKVAALLEKNAQRLHITEQTLILHADSLNQLKNTPDRPFDIAFIDPPFHQGLASTAAKLLEQHAWLTQDALVYVECESNTPAEMPVNWDLIRSTQAGESLARLYHRVSSPE